MLPLRLLALTIPLVLTLFGEGAVAQSTTPIEIGDKLGVVSSLRDMRGNRRSLSDFEFRALVLFFAGTDCPVTDRYTPRVIELDSQYSSSQVKFLAIYPNDADTFDYIAGSAYDRDVPYLLLKDVDQELSDTLGVDRTGSVAVLDADLVLRYRGAMDDLATQATAAIPEGGNLVQALDELLAGEAISVPETEAVGTALGRRVRSQSRDVTYSRDVAPILQRRCQACHRPGQIGPFSLLDYRDAVQWKDMVKEVVTERRMPPWQADHRYGKFSNDRSMPDDEVEILRAWVENGAPRGDPALLPEPVKWSEGWLIDEPDVVFLQPETVDVPAEGVVKYIYQSDPIAIEEDMWVQQVDLQPGDPSVVHHMIVYVRRPGERRRFGSSALVVWAPGDQPDVFPDGMALKVPAGSTLLWELHYTPNGVATTDRSSVGVVLAKEPPEREVELSIFSKRPIKIAPGSPHHRHDNEFTFKEDSRLISLFPHMHLRGKSWKYDAVYPDGRIETVLSVPRWDFNWQTPYYFAQPLFMPEGTVLKATAYWDNSENNLGNPDQSEEVEYGLQSWEEMMNGWVRYVADKPDTKGQKNR